MLPNSRESALQFPPNMVDKNALVRGQKYNIYHTISGLESIKRNSIRSSLTEHNNNYVTAFSGTFLGYSDFDSLSINRQAYKGEHRVAIFENVKLLKKPTNTSTFTEDMYVLVADPRNPAHEVGMSWLGIKLLYQLPSRNGRYRFPPLSEISNVMIREIERGARVAFFIDDWNYSISIRERLYTDTLRRLTNPEFNPELSPGKQQTERVRASAMRFPHSHDLIAEYLGISPSTDNTAAYGLTPSIRASTHPLSHLYSSEISEQPVLSVASSAAAANMSLENKVRQYYEEHQSMFGGYEQKHRKQNKSKKSKKSKQKQHRGTRKV
jgi:hypothetical protein